MQVLSNELLSVKYNTFIWFYLCAVTNNWSSIFVTLLSCMTKYYVHSYQSSAIISLQNCTRHVISYCKFMQVGKQLSFISSDIIHLYIHFVWWIDLKITNNTALNGFIVLWQKTYHKLIYLDTSFFAILYNIRCSG